MKKPTGNSPIPASSVAAASAAPAKAPIESSNNASPMYTERLRKLYAVMLRGRMLLENAAYLSASLRRTQVEACEAGVAYHLAADDVVAPSARDFMLDLARGGKLNTVAEKMGARCKQAVHLNGSANSKTRPALTVPEGVAAELAIGTGMAAVNKTQARSSITVAICSFSENISQFPYEVLNFAAKNNPGIVYVLYTDWDSRLKLREAALACDVPGIIVDGKDVVAVYRVAEEAVRRARQGMGPTLIDCRLERGRDPIKGMEEYLRKRKLWSPEWKQQLVNDYTREFALVASSSK